MSILSAIATGFGVAFGMVVFFVIAFVVLVKAIKAQSKKKNSGGFTPNLFRLYQQNLINNDKYEEAAYVRDNIIGVYERGSKPATETLKDFTVKSKLNVNFDPEKGLSMEKKEWIERVSDFTPGKH